MPKKGLFEKRIKDRRWYAASFDDEDEFLKWVDEAKKDFVKQSISLKDAITVLKDVDQTRIICFPVETFLKWFGDVDES